MLTKTDIEKYFFAEKQENLFFLMIGVIAILLAIAFNFFLKNNKRTRNQKRGKCLLRK